MDHRNLPSQDCHLIGGGGDGGPGVGDLSTEESKIRCVVRSTEQRTTDCVDIIVCLHSSAQNIGSPHTCITPPQILSSVLLELQAGTQTIGNL